MFDVERTELLIAVVGERRRGQHGLRGAVEESVAGGSAVCASHRQRLHAQRRVGKRRATAHKTRTQSHLYVASLTKTNLKNTFYLLIFVYFFGFAVFYFNI